MILRLLISCPFDDDHEEEDDDFKWVCKYSGFLFFFSVNQKENFVSEYKRGNQFV